MSRTLCTIALAASLSSGCGGASPSPRVVQTACGVARVACSIVDRACGSGGEPPVFLEPSGEE